MWLIANILDDAPHSIAHHDSFSATAQVQTVSHRQNPLFYDLIHMFRTKTQCSVLLTANMRKPNEPVANTPEDAYRCFLETNMDALVMGPFVLKRSEQNNRSKHQ